MKFLCVPCDTPMRLQSTAESEPGSLAVVYACPACGYEMAMLTNAQETQMVRSLGVRIGPAGAAGEAAPRAAAADPSAPAASERAAGTGRCPFGALLGADAAESAVGEAEGGLVWTPEALARLAAIPELVRPMAKAGIELAARESGVRVVDEAALAAARARFGM